MPAVKVVRSTRRRRARIVRTHPTVPPAPQPFVSSLAAKHYAPPFPEAYSRNHLPPQPSAPRRQKRASESRCPFPTVDPARLPAEKDQDEQEWASDDNHCHGVPVPAGRGSGKVKLAQAAQAAKAARRCNMMILRRPRYMHTTTTTEPSKNPKVTTDHEKEEELFFNHHSDDDESDWDDPMGTAHDLSLELQLEAQTGLKDPKDPILDFPARRSIPNTSAVLPVTRAPLMEYIPNVPRTTSPSSPPTRSPPLAVSTLQSPAVPARSLAPNSSFAERSRKQQKPVAHTPPPEMLLSRTPVTAVPPIVCSPSLPQRSFKAPSTHQPTTQAPSSIPTIPPAQPTELPFDATLHHQPARQPSNHGNATTTTNPRTKPLRTTPTTCSDLPRPTSGSSTVRQTISGIWEVLTTPSANALTPHAAGTYGPSRPPGNTIPWRAWLARSMGPLRPAAQDESSNWHWPHVPLPRLGQWQWSHAACPEDNHNRSRTQ